MSGLTLAAGQREARNGKHESKVREDKGGMGGIMGSLRLIELQLVAFIVMFSASGLVPLLDMAFPFVVSLYFFFLASFVFKSYQKKNDVKEVFHGSRMFELYVVLGTVVGLFLPLAYVLGGFARGDQRAVRAATPHLFLLSAQVLSENIISSMSMFSPPVRAVVPILYTGRRLVSLCDWNEVVFLKSSTPSNPRIQDTAWLLFGRGLALGNLIYFSVNLLFFLIPRFLPRAFERYFKQREESDASAKHGQPQKQDQ